MFKAEEALWLRMNVTTTWHAVLKSQLTGKQHDAQDGMSRSDWWGQGMEVNGSGVPFFSL